VAAGRNGSRSGGGDSDGELLVDAADRLRWRAPELALEFARQAARHVDGARDSALKLRANALVVAALVRLGKHAEAVQPAVLALREAETSGAREVAGPLRVDLAASTRTVGLAGSALVLVRPLLEGGDARPAVRAGALAEIVAGLAQAGRRAVVDEVLSEADRLYAADDSLTGDIRRVVRALLCARVASFRRRWGNATGAVAAATEGMALLDGLADPGIESGQARAELGLEMVTALLDAGEVAAALGQAEQSLDQPVRAPTAAAVGRLMFVLATRVHIPAGRVEEARTAFAEIVRIARRHGQDALLADVLTSLAHEQEAAGELTDALESLRSARAAEHRRMREDTMARLIVLEELGAGTKLPDDTESLLRRVVRSPARQALDPVEAPGMAVGELRWPDGEDRDAETGLLNRQGLRRRLAAARRQARPTALTLVRLDSEPEPARHDDGRDDDPDSTDRFSASLIDSLDKAGRRASPELDADVFNSVADHVRDMAPEQAELVRPDEDALAVLMPDTTRDEAEEFAATLRANMSTSDWDPRDPAWGVQLSTGVAQYQEGTSEDALLDAAREALTAGAADHNSKDRDVAAQRPAWQSVEPVFDLPSDDTPFGDVAPTPDGYTYIEEYASKDVDQGDPEMDAYLAGFSLPDYNQWPSIKDPDATPEPSEEAPEPVARHNAEGTGDEGPSVLDRLGITQAKGSGGRRRAPESFDPQPEPADPPRRSGRRRRPEEDPAEDPEHRQPTTAESPKTPEKPAATTPAAPDPDNLDAANTNTPPAGRRRRSEAGDGFNASGAGAGGFDAGGFDTDLPANSSPDAEPPTSGRRRARDEPDVAADTGPGRRARDNGDGPFDFGRFSVDLAAGSGGRRAMPEPEEEGGLRSRERLHREQTSLDLAKLVDEVPEPPVEPNPVATNGSRNSGLRFDLDADFEDHPSGKRRNQTYLSGPASGIGEEVLAAAASARASVPRVPEPDDVPPVPDSPDVPIPPDPDVDPKPGRRRAPEPLVPPKKDEPEPVPTHPDIDPPRGLTADAEPSTPSDETSDKSAWRRELRPRAAESVPSEGEPDRSAWRRRLSSPREGDPIGSEEPPQGDEKPSRLRRRDKTDVKLGDLLAEALVAYQTSQPDGTDEDVPSKYEDNGRHGRGGTGSDSTP
jgi:GGDEF domain-containing protein